MTAVLSGDEVVGWANQGQASTGRCLQLNGDELIADC